MDATGTYNEVYSTGIPRKSSASSTRSCSATERCRQELEDYDIEFDVRPPSGTNHQQPGKHLSIDTRFAELSLEDSSLVAQSERDRSTFHNSGTGGSIARNKNRPSRVQIPKPNVYITSPFKQGPEKDIKGPTLVVDPSFELKQRTIAGVSKVKRQLDKTKRTRNFNLPHSQLQRGNLKPLGRPVTASGPLIRNCQGIVASTRSYHGFARRQTTSSLDNGKPSRVFSTSDIAISTTARPDSPNQLLRPESSIHNTSCASSVNEANNDSDCSFSEDGSEDSIDGANQAERTWDYNKVGDHSEENHVCSSTGKGSHSELNSSCKPFFDHSVKRQNDDDDSDREDGRWAKQAQQSVDCHRDGESRSDETLRGEKTSGCNTSSTQGKQRSCVERNRSLSCDLGNTEVMDDSLTDSPNISSLKKSHQKSRDKPHLGSRESDPRQAVDSPSNPSCVNTATVIDVHISVKSAKEHKTTPDTSGSDTAFDEHTVDRLHGFHKDTTEQDVDDYLDSDALDYDRIPSADIFKVLDSLNLSTSAMKPPTPRGERFRVRRVQSAGYTRQTSTAIRDKKSLEKGAKSLRPPSSKRTGKKKEKSKDFHDSTRLNITAPKIVGRTEDLTKHVRKTLPGYFTEQYKKILDEQNENGKNMMEVKTDATLSSSLSLVTNETTDVRNGLERVEKLYQNNQTVVLGDFKDKCGLSEIGNDRPGSGKTETLRDAQNKRSRGKKATRSMLTGVFVTMDDKSDLRSIHDVEDSSSGVETMSCVTDSSFENFGGTVNQGDHDSARAWSSGHEDVYPGNVRQRFDDDDECDDKVADNDGSVDVGYVDDSDDDSSNLEVVAKTMPLSESRYATKRKHVAPFPPLCFNINAKPPEGQLYYFAYGPEMNPNRMAIYLRREPKTRLWGILFGFQLKFNKRGTSNEAGGFPNIEFNPEHSVEGCVYAITDTELTMLDNCMGYPKHYARVVFPVWMLNCTSPSEHGVAQHCVPAVLYVAQDEWVTHDSSQKLDCRYSVSQCVKASDILTPNYVQFLTNQVTS
ncbi:hypothetical protein ACROYT_G002886 [Oculina patagonica]